MLAVNYLYDAGKDIVLYTSGIWANPTIPRWIVDIIAKASCVFLSTDAFHAKSIDDKQYIRAARAIAEEGIWIVVQVINVPEMIEKAEKLLRQALGNDYMSYVEMRPVPPLAYGRGSNVFFAPRQNRGDSFGRCTLLTSPVVRYDGTMTPCCNEAVVMGKGPDRLRIQCASANEIAETTTQFNKDVVLKVMNRVSVGALTQHPSFVDFAQQRFSNICQLCWAIQERRSSLVVHSLNTLCIPIRQ